MSHFVDFTVDLLDGLLPDVEGRAEVTVTYPGHRAYFDPVTGAADPGSGPEIEVESIELAVPGSGRMVGPYYTTDYRMLNEADDNEGHIARMIRQVIENDADWIASAAQQARSAA